MLHTMHNMIRTTAMMALPLFLVFLAPRGATSYPVPTIDSVQLTDTLSMDTTVLRGRLPNGYTDYIRHNEEPRDRVVMYLATKVGSILETDEELGLARFLEHMQFNGTNSFPKDELVDSLQRAGVRFGSDLPAYTSF